VPHQPAYAHGRIVTLTAVADLDWVFTDWSGDASGSDNPIAITMDGDKLVTATFSPGNIPGVNVTPTTVDVEESGITATYSLSLNSEPTDIVTITITTDGQTVVEPVSVTFNGTNWGTSQQVVVAAVDDTDVEGGHVSTISHGADSDDSNYSGIAIADVVANVGDDDVTPALALVQFSGATYSVKETAGLANITVTLDTASTVPVTVTCATDDGTATDGYDYVGVDGTLRFDMGQTTQTCEVSILGDTALEGDETVRLTLSSPINAALGVPNEAVLTILDNVLFMPCIMREYGQ
jgi:chitinase